MEPLQAEALTTHQIDLLMKSYALDQNNDLIIDKGRFVTVDRGAQVVQQVRCRLLFYLGEWAINILAGTPYFQQIFIKPVNLANVESILKQRILETNGVSELLTFSMDFDQNSRRLSVSFSAETTFGEIINEEVTING